MTNLKPTPSALYQRARRLKIKLEKQAKQDLIDQNIAKEVQRIKQIKKQQKNNDWDFEGRDPQANLVPQYPEQKDEFMHSNFWHEDSSSPNPLSKVSHQQNLKALFGNRAE